MSGSWNNQAFQGQTLPGGVKLFDPTSFQAPMSVPNSGASNDGQTTVSQSQQPPFQPNQATGESSWSSWGNWGSWDWNGGNQGIANSQQTANQQQGVFANDTTQPTSSGNDQSQQNHNIHQGGHNEVPQYSQAWNQPWDGTGVQQQGQNYDQAYDQPDGMSGGSYDQHYQQQQQYQWGQPGTHTGANAQQAVYQGGQPQMYDGQFFNQQLQHQQESQPQQPNITQHNEAMQPCLEGPSSPQLYPQPNDHDIASQSHQYNQEQQQLIQHPGNRTDQGHHSHFQQHQGYYDQPYDASAWNGSVFRNDQIGADSGDALNEGNHNLTLDNIGVAEGADNINQENIAERSREGSLPQDSPSQAHLENQHVPSGMFDDNDDDGTVSGFFGRGDDDGDMPAESPRMIAKMPAVSDIRDQQLPLPQQQFQRTSSEISNASLMTLSLSAPGEEGDDDDGDPLHHVQELVQRMEATHLAQTQDTQDFAQQGTEHSRGIVGERYQINESSVNLPVSSTQHTQPLGDYSGFSSENFPGFVPSVVQQGLPLDTGNLVRPASPDGDDNPGSGGSGASGGSSGLTDWEIVPSQASSGKSHSRNSSLDNGVSGNGGANNTPVLFSADKPDGGMVLVSSSNNNSVVQSAPIATSSMSDFMNVASGDGSKQLSHHPSGSDLVVSHDPTLSSAEMNSRIGEGDQKSEDASYTLSKLAGNNSVPSSLQQSNVPPPPPTFTLGVPPPTSQFQIPPPTHSSDNLGNPFRRDGGKSPRHASLPQSSNSSNPVSSMPPPLPLSAVAPSTQSSSQHILSDSKPKDSTQGLSVSAGLSALPSRPKPPQTSSSTEDGIPARRREPVSNQDSDQHPDSRPHSAFHPVGRAPRRSAVSPSLFDQSAGDTSNTNILLAPVMPLIIPALNPYSNAASTAVSPRSSDGPDASSSNAPGTSKSKENTRKYVKDRREEDTNRSLDSLDEIDSVSRDSRERSFREQKDREERYRKETDKGYRPPSRADRPQSRADRPQSRADRPQSRAGQYHYDRDRPSSRAEGYGRDDPYRRNRGYYRDYGDMSFDERYDRPRSRQDESRGSRPTSRTGQQEAERPRSRTNYDRERPDRDYYGRKDLDRSRGYGYDSYGRHAADYYDERERYYRYYKEKEARYARGYYEEYYGANPDYYGRQASRPASRADYSRDYYHKGYDYSGYYYDGYGYDPYAYGYSYQQYDDSYNQSYDQGRLTPPKYSYPHTRVSFGPGGQLVKVLPNRPTDGQPAVVELQNVETLLQACPEAEELKRFPGPLTRANTHKKDVLLFCQQKAKQCSDDVSMTDRESAQLIWRLLELLIKQNGSVVGTDLSDLLLEGHEPSTHDYMTHGMRIAQSQSPDIPRSSSSAGADDGEEQSLALKVTQDRTVITSATSAAESEREAWIDRFRHLLLYGRKKDALECAMKNNLWGHALFLASKMDSRAHANVMTRFANSAMRMNDPLQTLYQLMSNRQPAAVTCIGDERWGDWRPHLAMMLSNQTSRCDLDRKSICTLGDTLASKGYLHASHFCYLMAQVSLGTYFKKTSKIVLIGSSHTLPMDLFATIEAIQCTEVYEYAQLLGNAVFCLPHFQMYKYLYACRLADYGMAAEALIYCEVIANSIQQYPAWFKPSFVKLVYQLSSKLKFSDPQRLHTSEDAEDPVWIQQLYQVSAAFEDGSLQPMSGTATPANLMAGTSASSDSGEYNAAYQVNNYAAGYASGADAQPNNIPEGYGLGQQMTSGAYYGQVSDPSATTDQSQLGVPDPTATTDNQQPNFISQTQQQYPQQQQQMQQQQPQSEWGDNTQQQWSQQQYEQHVQQETQGYNQQYNYSQDPQHYQYQQGQQDGGHQQQHHHHQHHHNHHLHRKPSSSCASSVGEDADDRSSIGGGSQYDASSVSSNMYNQGFATQQPQHPFPHGGLPPRASITTDETNDHVDDDEDDDDDCVDATTSGFDYFGNVSAQVVAPPHRYRTQSNSSSTGGRRRRTTSGSSTGSVKAAPTKSSSSTATSQQLSNDNKKEQRQQGSSWFGGFKSMFGRRDKNEMILPDDKDPAIIWDDVKKKWVNADGSENETAAAAPPPKDTDLMGGPVMTQPAESGPPQSSNSGPPPPSIGAGGPNRFSLKAKGARNQYVDVNNPKPLAVPSNLFNVMPPTAATTAAAPQVYMPGAGPVSDSNANNSLLSAADTSTDKPAPTLDVSTGDNSEAPQVPQMPMLFNPASLKTSGQVHGSAGPGLKYGQRRAYPK